ncbi:putative ycf20-like protein [Cocos nucifera]|uniref:Putative ycf20-like protein n=1 Tax=Cocos nucifera TaxID=13894 RepID=A0A8K0MW46_COCNU|nr:putative ycf20-like protein [Cocos nucifera]
MNSGTRLVRAVQSFQTKLTTRIKELKKGLWMKVLFFLVGFYCATAFATVIGQTGDWDILSAGLAVVVVEGIGALMYRASLPLLDKMRQLITIFNYWKAGLSLGLFLDAFKYEMDLIFDSCKPFNVEIDMFSIFW